MFTHLCLLFPFLNALPSECQHTSTKIQEEPEKTWKGDVLLGKRKN
jgi:hypothetical protein